MRVISVGGEFKSRVVRCEHCYAMIEVERGDLGLMAGDRPGDGMTPSARCGNCSGIVWMPDVPESVRRALSEKP